jgi:hypothetical protein
MDYDEELRAYLTPPVRPLTPTLRRGHRACSRAAGNNGMRGRMSPGAPLIPQQVGRGGRLVLTADYGALKRHGPATRIRRLQ